MFCSWGAEEQGIIGSREFVEVGVMLVVIMLVGWSSDFGRCRGSVRFSGGSGAGGKVWGVHLMKNTT